jgi:hypothetical protein
MSTSAEHQVRDGAPPNDGPVGAPPGPSAEIDRDAEREDAPTGLPTQSHEAVPLGISEDAPDEEGDPPRGEEAQPGIPTGGEPPNAG